MLILYNIVQLLALLLLWPFAMLVVMTSAKYRGRIPRRLGWGLTGLGRGLRPGPRLWLHALSVGEVASARPLLQALRHEMPEVVIILSSSTRGGEEYGRRLAGLVDCQVPFPLDFFWVVTRFIRVLRPDLFILVETDFWPNLLAALARQGVPMLLANGRITNESMTAYHRLRPLFAPLFNSFTKISMQMAEDARRLVALGLPPAKIMVCGNLKYDMAESPPATGALGLDLDRLGLDGRPLLVAGSTHPGEEELLLHAFMTLRHDYPRLTMIIAPRAIARASEVVAMGEKFGLACGRRSAPVAKPCQVLVLDTLGELAAVYQQADIAFVGGSLVPEGGHNPLEPASLSRPVLFGPHMSDFAEISRDLCAAGGAALVTVDTLQPMVANLLAHEEHRTRMGRLARELVLAHQGAARRYLALIREILTHDQ